MTIVEPVRLFDEFRQRRRDLFRTVGPGAIATLIAFGIAFYFVEPPPPNSLVIATGSAGGHYYSFAKSYAESLEQSGVELIVRETAGSVQNFDLLQHDDSVNLAIVQGGTAPAEAHAAEEFQAIASLYFEPLWVFHRADLAMNDLADLKGSRIAIGHVGSGSGSLATQLLSANGVYDDQDGTEFLRQNAIEAAASMESDEIDVAMFVLSPDAPVVAKLLDDPQVALMDFSRQQAYARRFPFLKGVVLEEGVVDFERNLPGRQIRLVAPAANLVATSKLHDAFIPLLLDAAIHQHHDGGLLASDGELPSLDYGSFPINPTARQYLDHGPSFFQRHLSFWIASLIDRTKIMIIPLLTLLIPLFKIAPPVYRWRIRSRIYRWYGVLRRIDQQLRSGEESENAAHSATLEAMSRELDTVHIPLSYMEEFYNLRLHLNLVSNELRSLQAQRNNAPSEDTPQSTASDRTSVKVE